MSAAAFVTLKAGVTVPLAAAQLALDLELRGLTLTVDQGDVLILGPLERVTDQDRNQFRRWKPYLRILADYIEREAREQ